MSTPNSLALFSVTNTGGLLGSTVQTGAPEVVQAGSNLRAAYIAAGDGVGAGVLSFDETLALYPSNSALLLQLTGTTAQTFDVTNLTGSSITGSQAGTPAFTSKVNQIICQNLGAGSVTLAQGSSNPLAIGLAGTTPTLQVNAGATLGLNGGTAGFTVSSTAKTLTITPAATTQLLVYLGGV